MNLQIVSMSAPVSVKLLMFFALSVPEESRRACSNRTHALCRWTNALFIYLFTHLLIINLAQSHISYSIYPNEFPTKRCFNTFPFF